MHLANGEKAILAYFHHVQHALKAVSDLREAGFSEIQMERITRPPITHEEIFGLRSMYNNEYAQELTGAHVSSTAQSISWSHHADIYDEHDYVVTIVADQPSTNHALSIVKKYASIVN